MQDFCIVMLCDLQHKPIQLVQPVIQQARGTQSAVASRETQK